tara:strand:+ start:138 stop:809 length:672 start_codon:yes stop_codon:yes gene_type:complete
MCFTENQSYINTILLVGSGLYLLPNYRLSISLIFLAIKDLIQGLTYYNLRNNIDTHFLTTLSWIHISFQPFIVNLFLSHFDKKFIYWNFIFLISILYGFYNLTVLKKFDIQNDGNCKNNSREEDDYCSQKTKSYIGKHHIGYKFKTDSTMKFMIYFWPTIMFIPSLFTKSRLIGIGWIIFVLLLFIIFNNVGSGEQAAIWCFVSIIYALPIALFHKHIQKILK